MAMNYLIVDPSQTMRRILINALGEKEDNVYLEAADGEQALGLLRSNQVDIIITEWDMPDMTGLSLAKAIKRSDSWKDLPIIMVTSRGSKVDVLEALKAQVDNFIIKPFSKAILKSKVEEAFNKSRVKNDIIENL